MKEYVEKDAARDLMEQALVDEWEIQYADDRLDELPAADVVGIPVTGIGDLSDGCHTFNGLYYQRMILFAALVKQNRDRAWKSYRHEDGELCFGGGWFIVGIDTPEGSYTYHYESKDFDLFDCEELPVGKHWDGHTEADVTRLLSLTDNAEAEEPRQGDWEEVEVEYSEDEECPTVDAVPVVRCKDCKHCFVDGDNVRFNVCELNHNRVQADDWFCADGERKGGDE